MDKILQLQGVSWFKRTAIANATITLYVKHYKDDEGVEHIDIDQALTGGIGGSTELRSLDCKSTVASLMIAYIQPDIS
jgi:hypothetical protein